MKNHDIDRQELGRVARGACLLASGGGGTYQSSLALSGHFGAAPYYPAAAVPSIAVDDIPASSQDFGLVVAYMGAPAAAGHLDYPQAGVAAALSVAGRLKGCRLAYVVPVEIGAVSSLVACAVAAKLGVAVVDADGAGRAVPELNMLTFAAEGVSLNPTVLANDRGLALALGLESEERIDAPTLVENIARPVLAQPEFGQIAGLALWAMSVDELRRVMKIRGTLTACREIGAFLETVGTRGGHVEALPELAALIRRTLGSTMVTLGDGVFESLEQSTGGGFDYGRCVLRTAQGTCTVLFQNESLLAWDSRAASPLAMAPDSIAYYVHDSQVAYSNGDLSGPDGKLLPGLAGKRVTLLGISANPALRARHAALAATPPKASGEIARSFQTLLRQMGYFGAYVPLEDRPDGAAPAGRS